MTRTIKVDELLEVLEEIRREKYPDIPADLISNIVNSEFEKQDDRVQGRKEVKKAIDDYLNTVSE